MTTNVLHLPGDYLILADNGNIVIQAAADTVAAKAPGQNILINTADTEITGNLLVDEDGVIVKNVTLGGEDGELGTAPTNDTEINPLGRFIGALLPKESAYSNASNPYNLGSPDFTWNQLNVEEAIFYSDNNTGNPFNRAYDPGDVYDTSAHRKEASVYVTGGVGIEKDLNVGGFIYGRVEHANTTTFVEVTGTNIDFDFYLPFVEAPTTLGGKSPVYADIISDGSTQGLRYNPFTGKISTDKIEVDSTTSAISLISAPLVVMGGAAIAKNVIIGTELYVEEQIESANLLPHYDADNTSTIASIGTSSTQWAEAYVHDLYTRIVASTSGPIEIKPKSGMTDVYGDIRVRGTNPIGTAPVITNVLYVTVDGNDTNDGRAQDASRACRTIGGAIRSAYFQPGTQIQVSAGRYLEDNPLVLKPYTSVKGSDIRTTFVEPINKTQDLWHLDSGCYLNYMTFLNGRSGLLAGEYATGYNRGAYATSFPPQTGDNRIDLFHSPYVQNCTNQSGPWLNDGSMFVPTQTVQVPLAVGSGSWEANTTSIVVSANTGTISIGHSINPGQQNPGFFNARTLLLANKPFLQSQVVAFIDNTFNSGSFVYNTSTCKRDTGLIVNAIATDMLYDSNSDSTFAGLQYWSQSTLTGQIPAEITATVSATMYLKSIALPYVSVGNQTTLGTLFNTVTNILVNGPTGVSSQVVYGDLPSTNATTLADYQALQDNRASMQQSVVDWLTATYNILGYDPTKCERDTGLIIDAIGMDMLYTTSSNSTFSGLQYWNQDQGFVDNVASESTATLAAIAQLGFVALRYVSPENKNEVASLFSIINIILDNGPVGVTDQIDFGGAPSTDTIILDNISALQTNKTVIADEIIAWITENYPTLVYTEATCRRDIGFMIDSVCVDLSTGGNAQSIKSGVYYYEYDATSTAIPNETTATIAAYTYIKSIIPNIVRSLALPTQYSGAIQVLSTNPGTALEAATLQGNIDVITGIITGGPAAGVKTSHPLTKSSSTDVNNAWALLQANRSFIQAEIIAYIDGELHGYNKDTCFRDVGYIIDSVAFDLLHDGNVQSIKSGVYYWGYNTTSVLPTSPGELAATTSAYNFIKGIIPNIATGQKIISTYQTGTNQTTSTHVGTAYEVATLQSNIDVITKIIRNGESAAEAKTPIALIENTSTGVLNAYSLLVSNISFIQEEVLAFINATMNNFTYNRQKSYRDVGILVENMAYDMAFGGNQKSVESGLAYWNGVISVIPNSITQCISAVDYLNQLSQKIVVNTTCPVLTPPAEILTSTQVKNTSLVGGSIAIPSITQLYNITTDIIANGPSVAPAIYNSPGPDAAFVSSEILLQANRTFIQENVINYINDNLCFPPKALPYNQIKCRRDAGIIVDSIASDLLFPTAWHSQSTFAGLQYYTQSAFVGAIKDELNPTIDAITYLRDLSIKVIQNITTATDALVGVTRYTDGIQTTASNYATSSEVSVIRSDFSIILSILGGQTSGWSDVLVPNGVESALPSVQNTVDLLLANKNYLGDEVVAYVNANNPDFTYTTSTCKRDVGYIIDSLAFDLKYGGNRQGIQAGLSYYVSRTNESVIPKESTATVDAFTFLGNLSATLIQGNAYVPRQTGVQPVLGLTAGSGIDAAYVVTSINTITNIVTNGPSVTGSLKPITLTKSASTSTQLAYNIIKANRAFIVAETIAYLDQTYNPNSFNYNQELCYRDTGLIIDAVSQDILLGGNSKSIEAGLSYWNQGYNYVSNQITTTTLAINYAKDLALQVISNTPVTPQVGTVATQVINTFFQYGGDYMPQEAVSRNFRIITDIIEKGPRSAPPVYQGGGLFSLTGLNGSSVKVAPKVTAVDEITTGTYLIGLDTPTIGFGMNATLYFGNTNTFPLQDAQVEVLSQQYTNTSTTWNSRKIDPIGSMGGSLVDGGVISERSPIQSFVYDAFTQVNQGGIGVKVTNNGYAQLVSVFTIFCSTGVICDRGGIASITNSNCNFGDISLLATGYGPRDFSGTVYNPKFRSYPFSPDGVDGLGNPLPYLDQFYPEGYWPNLGGRVEVFVPDADNRPHIGLVMEVVSPEGHTNEQGLPGFLNTFPSTSTITTGTITLNGISTTDVYVGNSVFIRDQFGRQYDDNGVWYAATGTVVSDVGYNNIILNQSLTSGGGDITNPTYFTVYFCGNSYYTVQTSSIANSPFAPSNNKLSANTDPNYEGPSSSQIAAHVDAITRLKTVVGQVIANIEVTTSTGNTSTVQQNISGVVTGGISSTAFIDLRFDYLINIVNAANLAAAEAVVPQSLITTSGTIPQGAGSAVILINSNFDFIADEIFAYVNINSPGVLETSGYQYAKCRRDVKLILQQLIYDLQSGGNYNMVYSGLSYWSRAGTYHVVELGEAVTRPDLFPDGTVVNFYQRSYISASGYLFEYVGAGTNYGALPQRGVADPVQAKETVQLNSGKVFFTSTDQNGDFRIGPGLVISQATGVLSGRTFVQSLYANMTPFILAIE